MESLDTHALSAAINTRLRQEARIAAGRAGLWHGLGIAALIGGLGIGIAGALIGYSYLSDTRPAAQEIAEVLAKALNDAKFSATATGEVKVAEGSEVGLKSGATVKLDPSSRLKIDPNAVIRADATITQPRLTDQQLQPDAAPETGAHVTTNYTVFKTMAYGDGEVVTGWNYASSEALTPFEQFCQYAQPVKRGSRLFVTLGKDARYIAPPPNEMRNFDPSQAYVNCQWFQG